MRGGNSVGRSPNQETNCMTGKAFVDTNILIYAHDESDVEKHRQAVELISALWTERRGVLSTQVIQEFAVNLQKRISVTLKMQEVRRRIEYFLDWEDLSHGQEYGGVLVVNPFLS